MNAPWQTIGHYRGIPPANDWREQLAQRLGQAPRRMSRWMELALYGALCCLDNANMTQPPASAHLRLGSITGTGTALTTGLQQSRDEGMLMPFTFLQSQPSQLLAALSQHLNWCGDAAYWIVEDFASLTEQVQQEGGTDMLLLGWIDDHPLQTEWRILRRQSNAPDIYSETHLI